MSEEEMKALVEMCQMLKAENTKLKEHLKRTHQIMTDMNEEITKLKQENRELKLMVNSPSITFTTCPECGKHYSINYCREVDQLKQEKKELIDWLEEEIKTLDKLDERFGKGLLELVLEKLGE